MINLIKQLHYKCDKILGKNDINLIVFPHTYFHVRYSATLEDAEHISYCTIKFLFQ